jgi:hypothetical protein
MNARPNHKTAPMPLFRVERAYRDDDAAVAGGRKQQETDAAFVLNQRQAGAIRDRATTGQQSRLNGAAGAGGRNDLQAGATS